MSKVVCVGWKSGKMCWDKTANLKRKLDNVEREKMTDGGGDYRKVWAVSRVGLGWGGSQAASAGRHTVCRTRCAAHTPVTLVECSPLMWQILCILRSVTTVNDFEVKSGMEHKRQHVWIALPHFEATWGDKRDKLPMICAANLDFTKAHTLTLGECSLRFWGDRSDAF